MRWVFASPCSTGLVLSLAAAAQAQSAPEASHERPGAVAPQASASLRVTREEGAESCPDTETLRAHVEQLRGHQTTSEPSAYHVRFSRRGGVFRAEIRVGAGTGARVLRDRRATCASLEQATALTLALLFDSDLSALPSDKTETETEQPRAVELPKPPDRPTPEPVRPNAVHLALSLGGAALFGVVQPVAPTALGEIGIGVNRFRTGIGVLWMPQQARDFGPGQLRQTLLSGVARTCLTAARSSAVRFDLCSGIYAGLLKVRAYAYTRNDSADKAWLAVPAGVSLTTTSAPIGVEVGASALFPLRRNDFSIDNLGVAFESWHVGMLLSMRAVGTWSL
ncbi:MAG TPA: hypothetical protein VHP33_36440 [Polyangiaceae bacterium]|nr:hypothetical protein [Polyangiaceae bacterium]